MIHKYKKFISLNEDLFDEFKRIYHKLFDNADEDIKLQLNNFFKKIDNETDFLKIVKVYDDYLSADQQMLNTKISNSQTKEDINNALGYTLKATYFSLKDVKLKLNDEDFSDTFEASRDTNFKNLMAMEEKKFSEAADTYITNFMIPQIEKMAGITNDNNTNESLLLEQDEVTTQPQQPNQEQPSQEQPSQEQPNQEQPSQEEKDKMRVEYRAKSIEWFDFIYNMIWKKLKETRRNLETNRTMMNNIKQISSLMKNSENKKAINQLLKKITTLSKEELNKVGEILELDKEELGDF